MTSNQKRHTKAS